MSQSASITNSYNTNGIDALRSCPVLGFYIWDTNQGLQTKWRTSLLLDLPDQPCATIQERVQQIMVHSKSELSNLDTIRVYIEPNEDAVPGRAVHYRNWTAPGMTSVAFMRGYDVVSVAATSRIHGAYAFLSGMAGGVQKPTVEDILTSMESQIPGYCLPSSVHSADGILAWHLFVIRHCLGSYMDANDLSTITDYFASNFPESSTMGDIIHNE